MEKEFKTDFKFYQLMITKPFLALTPGAYMGTKFEAKPMDEMCEMTFESPYVNVYSR